MARPTPPGFDKAAVTAGLHTAMRFGEPNDAADKATFCWRESVTTQNADEAGIPFDPNTRPVAPASRRVTVPCAVEYTDGADRSERFGTQQPSRITVTLLQPDYEKVAPFAFVVWGGDKYIRRSGQVDGLGSLDVHTIQCVAEDER